MFHTRKSSLAAVSAAFLLLSAQAAHAAATGATVTGDDGNPVVITPGLTIRHMNTKVGFTFQTAVGANNSTTVMGPDGAVAATRPCNSPGADVGYRGNGVYTVTLVQYANNDSNCSKAPLGPAQTFSYTVAAAVTLTGPTQRVLIRTPDTFITVPVLLPITLSPGALGYEVVYAKGAVLGPDGAITGPTREASVDTTTGSVDLRLTEPGTYTVVARQRGYATPSGSFYTPWTAPVTVRAMVPSDLSTLSFSDSLGPSFQITGYMREAAMAGERLTISMARGTAGRYRTIARPRVRGDRSFKFRFTQRRYGVYRLRVSFKGSAAVAGGSTVRLIRVRRFLS